MIDVSGFGTGIYVLAVSTFPMGFSLTQFSDDKDPLTSKEVDPIGYEMLYDGSLFAFDKAAPVPITVSVIPGSDDDLNLRVLLQAKKASISLLPAIPDVTTMVITYPDGGRIILTNGTILNGPLVDSIVQQGRKVGNSYSFVFGSYTGAQSVTEFLETGIQSLTSLL